MLSTVIFDEKKKSCLVLNLLVFIENTKVLKGIFFVFLFLSNKQYYFCNLKFFFYYVLMVSK